MSCPEAPTPHQNRVPSILLTCVIAHLTGRPQLVGLRLSCKRGWESRKLGFSASVTTSRLCLPPGVGNPPNTERGFRSGARKTYYWPLLFNATHLGQASVDRKVTGRIQIKITAHPDHVLCVSHSSKGLLWIIQASRYLVVTTLFHQQEN